jgi:Tol biopolymer transport system component
VEIGPAALVCGLVVLAALLATHVPAGTARPSAAAVTLTVGKPRRDAGAGGTGLFDVNTSTGAARSLGAFSGHSPAWSRDSKLAYVSKNRIWVASSSARSRRAVTSASIRARSPSWSPDGKRIAFACNSRSTVATAGICVVTLARGAVRQLTYQDVGEVRWSPTDANAIAFTLVNDGNEGEIWLVRPASGQVEPLASASGETFGSPAWSPDGTRIAYAHCHYARPIWIEVGSIGADGQGQRSIAHWDVNSPRPRLSSCPTFLAWSPDAATLAFKSARWLWTMPANGGNAVLVPNSRTSGYAGVAWRP